MINKLTNRQKLYKIRNKEGLFSTGGMCPYFNKTGKTWAGIGPLKNHLNCVEEGVNYSWRAKRDKYSEVFIAYEGCDIVEFEIVMNEKSKVSIEDFINGKNIFVKLEKALEDANTNSP